MKIYSNITVYDAALKRIRWLFSEFDNVVCSVSGGKDSTIVYELCLQVAKETKRLPLHVLFIDREMEWNGTIEQVRYMMQNPNVKPLWMQIPFEILNATSFTEPIIRCWDSSEKSKWMRPKEKISYKENVYGTEQFRILFAEIMNKCFPTETTCTIEGVRTDESPTRFISITSHPVYKGVTWGKVAQGKKNNYLFYPIYDWSYTDVWKAISDNNWQYNKVYNKFFNYGVSIRNMRISNLCHETAICNLFYLQEIEPDTYNMLTQRLCGVDMAAKMGKNDFFGLNNLPKVFKNWFEYRNSLLENLVINKKQNKRFKTIFTKQDKIYGQEIPEKLCKMHIRSILSNDFQHVKLKNFEISPTDANKMIRKKYYDSKTTS